MQFAILNHRFPEFTSDNTTTSTTTSTDYQPNDKHHGHDNSREDGPNEAVQAQSTYRLASCFLPAACTSRCTAAKTTPMPTVSHQYTAESQPHPARRGEAWDRSEWSAASSREGQSSTEIIGASISRTLGCSGYHPYSSRSCYHHYSRCCRCCCRHYRVSSAVAREHLGIIIFLQPKVTPQQGHPEPVSRSPADTVASPQQPRNPHPG